MGEWGSIVLAGGAAADLTGEVTGVPAPCLLPVANRTLVEYAVEHLARAGVARIVVVVENWVAEIVRSLVDEYATVMEVPVGTGSAGLLQTGRAAIATEHVVVHSCDALVTHPFEPLLRRAEDERLAALVLARRFPGAHSRRPGSRFRAGPRHESVQVALLAREVLEAAEEDDDLTAIIERLGDEAETLALDTAWRHAGGPESLLEANRLALDIIEPDVPQSVLDQSTVHGRVRIDASASARRSLIRGPAIVGRKARLLDAYVGPYSVIGDGAFVENAEVDHSVLLQGAELRNVASRLEASVVGPGAHVSRPGSLPAVLRLLIGPDSRVDVS